MKVSVSVVLLWAYVRIWCDVFEVFEGSSLQLQRARREWFTCEIFTSQFGEEKRWERSFWMKTYVWFPSLSHFQSSKNSPNWADTGGEKFFSFSLRSSSDGNHESGFTATSASYSWPSFQVPWGLKPQRPRKLYFIGSKHNFSVLLSKNGCKYN